MAPSPTAEATRLADSARASPATNTPGTLVSRWYGRAVGVQPGGRAPSTGRSGPAMTKPRSSRTTTPSSQSVRGAAPMKTNSHWASTISVAPVGVVAQGELLQVLVAVRRDHLGAGADRDVVDRRDLLDQVVRHRLLQRGAAHQDGHRPGVPGEVDGGLAGRVGAADDVDVLAGAVGRLGQGRAVVDAAAGELVDAGRGRAAGRRRRWPG